MPQNFDIFTGRSMGSALLEQALRARKFTHGLWFSKTDYDLFMKLPAEITQGLRIKENSSPIFDLCCGAGDTYFNISQVSEPSILLNFYLYNRQFLGYSKTLLLHSEQCMLIKHAIRYGYKNNVWVSTHLIKSALLADLKISLGFEGVPIERLSSCAYNVEQLKCSREIIGRLNNMSRWLIGGKLIHFPLQKQLYDYLKEYGYSLPLWITREQAAGFRILSSARHHLIQSHEKKCFVYNIGALADPLEAYKLFSMEIRGTFSCFNAVTNKPFRRNECMVFNQFRRVHRFSSGVWVRCIDMKLIGQGFLTV